MTDGEDVTDLVNAHSGGISFEDVRFGYSPDRQILKGLTFEVREASCTAHFVDDVLNHGCR